MPSSPASTTTSPAAPDQAQIDQLLQEASYAYQQADAWETIRKQKLAELADLHAQGLVQTKFTAYGFNFSINNGRESWSYDDAVKEHIKLIQQDAQKAGEARKTRGAPFWTLRPAKPAQKPA